MESGKYPLADLLVYEGFQYGTAGATRATSDLLHGQPDGVGGDVDATGLGGTWQDSTAVTATTDLFVASGSLTFGDLVTSGNHVRSDTNNNNDIFSRPITANLSSGGDLWFSFLANKLQNNFSAAQGGVIIANTTVNNSKTPSITTAGLIGFGIAPTSSGNNWTAYAWDGTSMSVGDAAYTVPVNGSETNLLIGHVSYGTGSGGADQFSIYYYTLNAGSITGGTMTQIGSTLEVNADESTLDTLNLTRQVNTAYDEIRIGTTQDDVLGLSSNIPEPATLALFGIGGLLMIRRRRA